MLAAEQFLRDTAPPGPAGGGRGGCARSAASFGISPRRTASSTTHDAAPSMLSRTAREPLRTWAKRKAGRAAARPPSRPASRARPRPATSA